MAESQDAYTYKPSVLDALDASLSSARIGPYLARAAGDRELAIRLYLWNARLAKAFLYPLQIAEVATRNSMHRVISGVYGRDWLDADQFATATDVFPFTGASAAALHTGLDRLMWRMQRQGRTVVTSGDRVACLSFDFWSNLFRFDYEGFWIEPGRLKATFASLPDGTRRSGVMHVVKEVNDLRNRIAHHEPIHHLDLGEYFKTVLKLIEWTCPTTARWVRRHSTVQSVLDADPTKASSLPGRPLVSTNLRAPVILPPATPLNVALGSVAAARPAVALVADPTASPPFRALLPRDIMDYLAGQTAASLTLVDLAEHTVSDVLEAVAPTIVTDIDLSATTGDVKAIFFPPKTRDALRPRVIVVMDRSGPPAPVGVILHPEIPY